MSSPQTDNLNIAAFDRMPSPDEITTRVPLSPAAEQTVLTGRRTLQAILDHQDPRLFVVVGPCSIHDTRAAREYAQRLCELAKSVPGHLAAAASMLDAVSASERANWALGDTVTLRGMSEPTQLAILA
mgnify:CR=1 FL=1